MYLQVEPQIRGASVPLPAAPAYESPLHEAAANGDLSRVEELLNASHDDIDAADSNGWTALHFAAFAGHNNVVEKLLAQSAKSDAGCSVLLAEYAGNTAGWTALHLAAAFGRKAVVEQLLRAGADTIQFTAAKHTDAASGAAASPDLITKVALVSADMLGEKVLPDQIAIANSKGWTALHFAAHAGHDDVVEVLLAQRAKRDAGCSFHLAKYAGDTTGWTALHLAAAFGHKAIVERLLGAGADINQFTAVKHTALHMAAYRGKIDVVRCLLEKDSNVAEFAKGDRSGTTALHLAAKKGHWLVAKAILKKGAFINQEDDYKRTALHFAVKGSLQRNREADLQPTLKERFIKAGGDEEICGEETRAEQGDASANAAANTQERWKCLYAAMHLLHDGAEFNKLEKHLRYEFLVKMKIAPVLVDTKRFVGAMQALALVAVLLATVAYAGWLNPPGGWNNGQSIVVPSTCAIPAWHLSVNAAEAGLVNPDDPDDYGAMCDSRQTAMYCFFLFNALTFYLAVSAVIAATLSVIPVGEAGFFNLVDTNRKRLKTVSICLTLALLCALGAFTCAGFAAMPYHKSSWLIVPVVVGLLVLSGNLLHPINYPRVIGAGFLSTVKAHLPS